MTSDITTCKVPEFRTHSPAFALVRAAWVVILCAALTAGFLTHVWQLEPASDVSPSDFAAHAAAATGEAS
jgi:hypothetical protein